MRFTAICNQFTRGISVRASLYKVSPTGSQHLYFSTTKVPMFHHRISAVPDRTQQKLRKEFGLSNDYFVVYKEPKLELNHMIILKCSELGLYTSPLLVLLHLYLQNETLESFLSQDDFYIGVSIVCVYLLGIRFCVNGFVKIIFYNSVQDVYRAYVLNKYKPTYKFVDFKSKDLKVLNLHPDIPMARNFFKAGKQHLILHDDLFASPSEQDKLIGEAIEKWHAHWGR